MDLLQAIAQGLDTAELMKKHEQEQAALEARFEAEEARHTAEITKKLEEEHMEEVKQEHKALLDKVRTHLIDTCVTEAIFVTFVRLKLQKRNSSIFGIFFPMNRL